MAAIAALLLALPAGSRLLAQTGDDAAERDWRMPFRQPSDAIDPPQDVWSKLRPMLEIREHADPGSVRFEHGREVVDDARWRQLHQELMSTRIDAGYLSLIVRESGSLPDRRLALYGMFYISSPEQVFQMIEHIPGEPDRALREEAMPRAVEFSRLHFGKRNPGDLDEWRAIRVGPAGRRPPRPGDYSFGFDPAPFLALLEIDDWRDHAQALWFLARTAEQRPDDFAPSVLERALPVLPEMLTASRPTLRRQAFEFVRACDPSPDDVPDDGAEADDETLRAWLDRVVYELFPPIRHVHDGLVEIWPSADLDAILTAVRTRLAAGTLGRAESGQDADGQYFRGVRLQDLSAPLDLLGLPDGVVITAVNGVPVTSATELRDTIRRLLASRPQATVPLLVEMVHDRRRLAREFRIHRD